MQARTGDDASRVPGDGGQSAGDGAAPDGLIAGFDPAGRDLVQRAWSRAAAGEADVALSVALAVHDIGLGPEPVAAALLRYGAGLCDAAEVAPDFGRATARLVEGAARLEAIASRPSDAEARRGAEHADRLRRLVLAIVRDMRVVLVVLARRATELRSARGLDPGQRRTLARSTLAVHAPLASRLGVWQLKWELEDLAFRELEPDAYADIVRRLAEKRDDRERYVTEVVETLRERLRRGGIDADVSGRPKHIYSIWRKMRSKGLDFAQVFDLRAVRVLVDDVPGCYAALGVVHACWSHVPHEFDDYITNPKANGYQSLHTAVIGPMGRTVEVQIRTRSMHSEAELGIAAHWSYKEGAGRKDPRDHARVAWLRRLVEWGEEPDGSRGLMEQFSSELFQDRVYVFTPRGDIVDLPQGATPLDFAYHVHTEVGHRCRGAKVNGAIVPLTRVLESGDKVDVLTTRQPRPSRDWLNPNLGYLATPRARSKVRQWLKLQDYERNLADGQDTYQRELRRLGISEVDEAALAARFQFARFGDVLAALGRGDVSVGQLVGALQHSAPGLETEPAAPRPLRRPRGAGGEVRIQGVGNLLVQMARCCRPVPRDPIVGYITRGRGVSIHRNDCRNMLRLSVEESARLIDVSWESEPSKTYPVEVLVEAFDRQGLLRDITNVIANEGVNVVGMSSRTESRTQNVTTTLTVEVENLAQLSRVLDRITQLANVHDARRRV